MNARLYSSERNRLRLDPKSVKIRVTKIEGGEDSHAHILEGVVTFRGLDFDFKGVAFGRIGGFNIRAEFTNDSRNKLQVLGLKTEEINALEVYTQRMIIEGKFTASPNITIHEHRFE